MSMIKIENLSFAYPCSFSPVFEDLNLIIDTDWKLGFVGRNGRGKSTLVKILAGQLTDYQGHIIHNVDFDYFPYTPEDASRDTVDVLHDVAALAEDWEFMREFSYLDLTVDVLYRPWSTLSQGEQTKALLAAMFVDEGHFHLIDEPTNHLDMEARGVVAQYLKRHKGFIVVSHDQEFMDRCIDHVLTLNRTNIEIQTGNFSTWLENFNQQQNFEQEKNAQLRKDIKRLRQAAQRTSQWSEKTEASKIGAADKGFVGHKAAKMMKRSKSIESRQNEAIEKAEGLLKNAESAEKLKLSPLRYHSDVLAHFANVQLRYADTLIGKPLSFTLHRGERVALSGKNGSGKSSLFKLLMGQKIHYAGIAEIGQDLKISYVPQDVSELQGPLSGYAALRNIDDSLLRTILRKMDFERDLFSKNMEDLSEGQKKKILIAASLCEQAHLYVWDEPLNYIDIYSRLQIEELIAECAPTMIFVEHDQAFEHNVATRIVEYG
ncbi:ribosomal protection-like ABC-F family protein [Alloscardovia criceti]|uniref:ribosomal protection-like ABC-F family protein n=1 Tax=Alloscardovia criceti TaxID=356828 RepID=UPI00036F94DB|nr:ABC-F type ribosomal protection protein [Alloscardovia criceti]